MTDAARTYLVSVDDPHAERVREVAERLRSAGMRVHRSMESLGAIEGTIDPARIDAVRAVEGVAEVEEAREYRLAPPESDLQ